MLSSRPPIRTIHNELIISPKISIHIRNIFSFPFFLVADLTPFIPAIKPTNQPVYNHKTEVIDKKSSQGFL